MEVLDIVQAAAIKSGVLSSFNIDDVPGDVQDVGVSLLANQILPQINCDRTLDVTTTSRVYAPQQNRIVLKPLKQPINDFRLLGYSKYTAEELTTAVPPNTPSYPKWVEEINRLYKPGVVNWPQNDFGDHIELAMWSSDMKLILGADAQDVRIGDANIDFAPMRIDAVIDIGTMSKYTYLYRDEFEMTINAGLPGVYTTEEYDDKLVILLKGSPTPKTIVIPVPLTIINRTDQYAGTIIAPPKFRRYLIDATAVQLAVVYGVATVDMMRAEASVSYNMIKKNAPQPIHAMNVAEHINDTLHRYRRRYYENF